MGAKIIAAAPGARQVSYLIALFEHPARKIKAGLTPSMDPFREFFAGRNPC